MRWREGRYYDDYERTSGLNQVRRNIVSGLQGAIGSVRERFATPRKKNYEERNRWEDDEKENKRKKAERKRKLVKAGLGAALGLAMVGGLMTGAGSGIRGKVTDWLTNFVRPHVTQAYEPTDVTPEETPEPASTPESLELTETVSRQFFFGGKLEVEFDANYQAVAYTPEGGSRVIIDRNNLDGPILFGLIDMGSRSSGEFSVGSKEHPVLDELPDGVLTEEELRQRGIEIIQVDRIKLFVQKSAFEKGGILEQLINSGDRRVKIVLVDGILLDPIHMQGEKYDKYRQLLASVVEPILPIRGNDLGDYRRDQIDFYKSMRDDLQAELDKYKRDGKDEEASLVATSMIEAQFKIELYTKMSDVNLTDDYRASRMKRVAGRYLPSGQVESILGPEFKDTVVVFLAVGSVKTQVSGLYGLDEKGDFFAMEGTSYWPGGGDPDFFVSAPNPDEVLSVSPNYDPNNPGSYPFGIQPGIDIGLFHEFGHGINESGGEAETDFAARDKLAALFSEWVASGYSDKRGWPFIWGRSDGKFVLGRPVVVSGRY